MMALSDWDEMALPDWDENDERWLKVLKSLAEHLYDHGTPQQWNSLCKIIAEEEIEEARQNDTKPH